MYNFVFLVVLSARSCYLLSVFLVVLSARSCFLLFILDTGKKTECQGTPEEVTDFLQTSPCFATKQPPLRTKARTPLPES